MAMFFIDNSQYKPQEGRTAQNELCHERKAPTGRYYQLLSDMQQQATTYVIKSTGWRQTGAGDATATKSSLGTTHLLNVRPGSLKSRPCGRA